MTLKIAIVALGLLLGALGCAEATPSAPTVTAAPTAADAPSAPSVTAAPTAADAPSAPSVTAAPTAAAAATPSAARVAVAPAPTIAPPDAYGAGYAAGYAAGYERGARENPATPAQAYSAEMYDDCVSAVGRFRIEALRVMLGDDSAFSRLTDDDVESIAKFGCLYLALGGDALGEGLPLGLPDADAADALRISAG